MNRAAGSHKISAQKFMYVREFLTVGCSVLGVSDAGHWVYKHAPDACFEAVKAFILGAK